MIVGIAEIGRSSAVHASNYSVVSTHNIVSISLMLAAVFLFVAGLMTLAKREVLPDGLRVQQEPFPALAAFGERIGLTRMMRSLEWTKLRDAT